MDNNKSPGLLRALGLTSKFIGLHIQDKFIEEGIELTRPQFVLLRVLSEQGEQCQNDLAFITERDKTSMARLVTSLEKKGLVIRTTDKHDLRKKIIFLSEDGRNMLSKAWPIMKEVERSLINDIDPKDIQITLATIKKIQQKVFITNGVKL